MDKIINVFDLGPGDGGKGGVVHALSCANRTRVIFKVGGAQGSHGVTAGRNKFAFSQWGCGTFEGVKTHITPRMVISPDGLLNEADGLRYHGVTNAFDLLTIDERAICATPYHGIASKIKELALGTNPRGTIGTGVGETYRDIDRYPELVIRASDLRGDIAHRLDEIRILQNDVLSEIVFNTVFLPEDLDLVEQQMELLTDPGFFAYCVSQFRKVGEQANIVKPDFIQTFFEQDGVGIVESSHGILTDNCYGFQPHVSAIRTLPSFTEDMLRESGFDGEIERIGVHRAYAVRHGAGPLPTANPSMNESLLPGSHKADNRWQGSIRVGPLDFVLLRYALEVCGGLDGLALSWFDQIAINSTWQVCNRYSETDEQYFHSDGRIKVFEGKEADMADYQQGLCSSLLACKPVLACTSVPLTQEKQFEFCNRTILGELGVPIRLLSFGPSEQDKLIKEMIA
jgi:adenylosuccinate synthase